MSNRAVIGRALKAVVLFTGAGMMFAMSCSSQGVQAVVAGIGAASDTLSGRDRDNDMDFGDWLIGELDD